MFIPDPRSWIQEQQEEEGTKIFFVVLPDFVAINFPEFKIILFLNRVLRSIFYPKELLRSCQKRVGEPGSAKNLSQIRIQGVEKHRMPGPEHFIKI